MTQYRQGDIFFTKVKSIPKTAKIKKDKIVAYGEATGHHHRFSESHATLLDDGFDVYIEIKPGVPDMTDAEFEKLIQDSIPPKGAALKHEEHGTIILPPGKYKVTYQREYTPERIRRVID